jgi:putative transposase
VEIETLPPADKHIGLDMGISALATTSDGEKITNPKAYRVHKRKLAHAQKHLARKVKGSANRNKARRRVARIHRKISDIRKDQLHKLTTRLVRENQSIAIEDLAVRNMLKNHCLAGSISDASWGTLKKQLEYKCKWYGRELRIVDRWFPSSKTCHECGHVVSKLPLNIRQWDCPKCSASHDRDVNAAKNILAAGVVVNACGGAVNPKR